MNKVRSLFANPHTSCAAIVYALCELLSIWFPDYQQQLDQTKGWAVVYGFLLAGDGSKVDVGADEKTPPSGSSSSGGIGLHDDRPRDEV